MCCTQLAENTGRKNLPFVHHCTTLLGYIFATKACTDNRKKNLLDSNIFSTVLVSSHYCELRLTNLLMTCGAVLTCFDWLTGWWTTIVLCLYRWQCAAVKSRCTRRSSSELLSRLLSSTTTLLHLPQFCLSLVSSDFADETTSEKCFSRFTATLVTVCMLSVSAPTIRFLTTYGASPNLYNNNNSTAFYR